MDALVITPDDPADPAVRALLDAHLAFSRAVTPIEHVHALELHQLEDPAVTFFGGRRGGDVVVVAALRHLDESHVELKSMHTSASARRGGAGRAMLDHLLRAARRRGYERVSLETGATDAFAPARALYEQAGFRRCEPFGDYTDNPFSVCMTLLLHREGGGAVGVRRATLLDVPAITAIANAGIRTTTTEWTEEPHTEADRQRWLAEQEAVGRPVLVAEDGGGVVGWASYGDFRDTRRWPGYLPTVEHSVHVRQSHWGRGAGRALMEALMAEAVAAGKRVMIGAVDGANGRSLAFHLRLGFVEVGRLPGIGEKFGKPLDLVLLQRDLRPPGRRSAPLTPAGDRPTGASGDGRGTEGQWWRRSS